MSMPAFVPSTETVEAAAKALARLLDRNLVWDEAAAHVRNFYMREALSIVNAAGNRIVADVFATTGRNYEGYGLPPAVGGLLTQRAAAMQFEWLGDNLGG